MYEQAQNKKKERKKEKIDGKIKNDSTPANARSENS
jgi:hypothetical protein